MSPQQRKLFRLKGWGFQMPMYLLVCCSPTLSIHGYIFLGPEQKTPKGNFFFLEERVEGVMIPSSTIRMDPWKKRG